MKKYINILFCALMLAATSACSNDDEPEMAKAVLTSAETLTFGSTNAEGRIITIYSDAEWAVDAPDWISVCPSNGTGTTDVTVTVMDNYRDGEIDNPRTDTIAFHGTRLSSYAYVTVMQDGNRYRGISPIPVTDVFSAEDDAFIVVKDAVVNLVSGNSMIISDKSSLDALCATAVANVNVGDEIRLYGQKVTDENGCVAVNTDRVEIVTSDNSIKFPNPTDIDGCGNEINQWAFITIEGVVNGNTIELGDKSVFQFKTIPLDSNLNGHLVKATGYYAGRSSSASFIIPVNIEDKGVKEVVYWSEDFEWLKPYAEASGAGNTVETDDLDSSAPRIVKAKIGDKSSLDALEEKGYSFLRVTTKTPGECIYLQSNYLKFGKTSYQAGIVLPCIGNVPTGATAKLVFDWCPMRQGSGKIDPVNLIIIVENGGVETVFDVPTHNWENGHKLQWITAEVALTGVEITSQTKLTIRQTQWPEATANRWFLDNIRLLQAQ